MIQAKEIKIVPIDEIKPNQDNRKKHPKKQIERLAKIIETEGFRSPLIISNRSQKLIAGHGRLLAAKHLKLTEVPVIYQDFDSDEQEYRVAIADNAISEMGELDLSKIHVDLSNLDAFDIDLLGIDNFQFEPISKMPDINLAPPLEMITCPHCKAQFEKNQASSTIL